MFNKTSRPLFSFNKKIITIISSFIALVSVISCSKEMEQDLVQPAINDVTNGKVSAQASIAINTYYVAPSGDDNNNGSLNAPFKTLTKAWTIIAAGDLVYLRGGTYTLSSQLGLTGKNGTASNPISIWAYPGETPVFTRASSFSKPFWHRGGIFFTGNYFHWKGIELTGFSTDDNQVESALLAYNSSNNTFERLNSHHNVGGFYIEGNSSDNLIVNSDFHDNYSNYNNSNGGNSDGLDIAYCTGNGNIIRGCRAWNNGDDGFDNYENSGTLTIENSWSWHNGYYYGSTTAAGNGVGLKLGSTFIAPSHGVVKRRIQNNLFWDNRDAGIHINGADYICEVYNNVMYGNHITGMNFHYANNSHIFRNNVSFANTDKDVEVSAASNSQRNSAGTSYNDGGWSVNASISDFVSLNATGSDGPRKADGSLPDVNFLKLSSSSSFINTGMNVGLPFVGNAPDRGAYEYGTVITNPVNAAPIVNAGSDKNVTLPASTVSITGSATDADGSIASYAWSLRSGPNTGLLSGITSTTLSVSSLIAGTYIFRLTATDNAGATGFDEVSVNVSGITPVLPTGSLINVAQAGSDGGYAYYVTQDFGTAADDNSNTVRSVLRIFENGIELKTAHAPHSDIRNIGNGRFSHWSNGSMTGLYFSASDNSNPKTNGRIYTYTTGTTATNQPPVANAGADKSVTLPTSSFSITGSGTDADGSISTYAWTLRSGPNTPVLSGASTTTLSVSSLIAGSYTFRLTVTDNGGLSAYDEVTVTVNNAPAGVVKTINVAQASTDGGYAYYVTQNFGTSADDNSNPTRSVLRIFENGIEMKPPHASHATIRNIGKGRFSHWSNGNISGLYFSASDNTNPKTNGRVYTYSIQ